MKNVLLLNAGTRNKLVRDFKKELHDCAKVIATDNYNLAPALYEADVYYITDWYTSQNYWNQINDICEKEEVGLIISLIDPELEHLAKKKNTFWEKGILTNIGDYSVVHDCFDKYKMSMRIREMGLPWIPTYIEVEEVKKALRNGEVSFPLFGKPRYGSGSAQISKIEDEEALLLYCKSTKDYLIQPYMDAEELGVDVYVDLLSKEVISIFAKKKLKMRAGETDKSVSFLDDKLFAQIEKFVNTCGLEGVNDIDVFVKDGTFYISEVNPRFGGGYLHAYECGENFPQYLINNMNGIVNQRKIGTYESGIYMMKYFDIKILKEDISNGK